MNPDVSCEKICLLKQEKQAENNTKSFNDENFAENDYILVYKYNTPTQLKNSLSYFFIMVV